MVFIRLLLHDQTYLCLVDPSLAPLKLFKRLISITASVIQGFILVDPTDEEKELGHQVVQYVFGDDGEICYFHCHQV